MCQLNIPFVRWLYVFLVSLCRDSFSSVDPRRTHSKFKSWCCKWCIMRCIFVLNFRLSALDNMCPTVEDRSCSLLMSSLEGKRLSLSLLVLKISDWSLEREILAWRSGSSSGTILGHILMKITQRKKQNSLLTVPESLTCFSSSDFLNSGMSGSLDALGRSNSLVKCSNILRQSFAVVRIYS